jgi:hypothetical protein
MVLPNIFEELATSVAKICFQLIKTHTYWDNMLANKLSWWWWWWWVGGARYLRAEMVLMEQFWVSCSIHLPVVLLKKVLSCVQVCVKITDTG